MLLQALPRSPQCMAAVLLAAPSTLLSAARGAAGALAEDAAEVTAEALCEGHALLREVLGLEAVRGWVLLPLQRLWRGGTEGRLLAIQLVQEGRTAPARQLVWAQWGYRATAVTELLQLHLELRGEKALDYDLYVGDYTGASLRPGNDARVVSLHAACAGGAPRRGLASGSPRRVANVLRGLLAAAGVRLWSRCEAVDLDDTVEDFALPFTQLTAVACKRSITSARLETLPRAGEAKHDEIIAAVSPVASLPPRPEAVQLDTPPSPVRTPPSPVRTAGAPAGAHGGGRPPLSPMHTPPPSVHTAGPQAPARRGAPGERPPAAMEAGGKAATPLPVSVLPSHALLDLHSSPGSSQPSSPTVEGAHERGANAGIWQ